MHDPAAAVAVTALAMTAGAGGVEIGWQTVMQAATEVAAETFHSQGIYTVQPWICLALGVDQKVMNAPAAYGAAAT